MEASGQIHALAALATDDQPDVPFGWKTGLDPQFR
jgi:hypothetical protein